MSDLEIELEEVVKRVSGLSSQQVAQIVQHLMSPTEVGVTSMSDLADLTLDLMPQNLSLSPLKKIQLLDALKGHSNVQENLREASTRTRTTETRAATNEPSTSSGRTGTSERGQSRPNSSQSNSYKFRIRWSDIPQELYNRLKTVDAKQERANPADQQALKLAISKKLVSSYLSYREVNPGSQLSPGREVYKNLTAQVFLEFKQCFKVEVNGKVIGDGTQTFATCMETCVENLLRRYRKKKTTRVSAKKGKGTVGVLPSQYEPTLAPASQTEQEGIRDHLQNCHEFESLADVLEEVSRDLDKTYELQRGDIIKAREDVLQDISDDEDENEDADRVVVPREPAVKKLLKQWPYLFYPAMMRKHHNRLTGRDIKLEMEKFCENNLEILLLYMTTSSNANIDNMALKLNADQNNQELTIPDRFMLALQMVANHFKEDTTLLIYCAERTLRMEELDLEQTAPCIVVFGQDPIGAKDFAVCADKTPLMKCSNACEAVTSLFEICFVLDLEYPNLKSTVEFFERFVFGMGFSDTRVEKNGKTLLTLTEGVKRLINGLQSFEEKLQKAQGKN